MVPNDVTGLYAYSVTMQLHQWMISQVTHAELQGATWDRATFGTVGANNVRDLRGLVSDYVDAFINAYLATNPKQP
jgi:hypothetical protein